jgi:aspartate carbamoyltransferase catalytic subunit
MTIRHLLDIKSLSDSDIKKIFSIAKIYLKSPKKQSHSQDLKGRTLINLFFENSTRTRSSFEVAAYNLGANVINIDVSTSSLKKGESEIDTVLTLCAMQPSFITIRHSLAGSVQSLARHSNVPIINSGDGAHSHPTQALLDAFTILQKKGKIKGLNIAICGDILNSRVARSDIELLKRLGANIRLIAPPTLLPKHYLDKSVGIYSDMSKGLKDVDVIIMLRLQNERMANALVPSMAEYYKFYGLDREKLAIAKPDAIILHPGPMNRGVEIETNLADDSKRCMVWQQVSYGIIVRQAILSFLKPS